VIICLLSNLKKAFQRVLTDFDRIEELGALALMCQKEKLVLNNNNTLCYYLRTIMKEKGKTN
jgi:hypothetical protein